MSTSGRAKHVMSMMLVVVFALSGSAWATTDRTAHCSMQMESCHRAVAVLTCCAPSAPAPIDRVALLQGAPSPVHGVSAPLVDHLVVPVRAGTTRLPAPRLARVVALHLLHRSFVI